MSKPGRRRPRKTTPTLIFEFAVLISTQLAIHLGKKRTRCRHNRLQQLVDLLF
jgi:hypothetical protein